MCRMIAAPDGVPGRILLPSFLAMAKGLNTLNDVNQVRGSVRHGDGWGAVVRGRRRSVSYRSLLPCWEDRSLWRLEKKTVLGLHARRATYGSNEDINNIHPFLLRTRRGDLALMHNGTIRDKIHTNRVPRGGTDSERYFLLLVQALERNPHSGEAVRASLESLHDYTALNAFLFERDALWTIAKSQQDSPYYTLYSHYTDWGTVIASEPLGAFGGSWVPVPNGSITRHSLGEAQETLVISER